MSARARFEWLAAVAATLLAAAFVVSFLHPLLRSPARAPASRGSDPVVQQALSRPAGTIEVLNASGRPGLARAATHRLRDGGFDVKHFGNAFGFDGDTTLILDRTGDDAVARAVARFLGVGVVRTQPDTTLFLDATVVIGRDWRR